MASKQRASRKKYISKSFDFMHCKNSKELAALLVDAGYQCPKDTWDLSAMRQYAKLQGVNFVPDGVVVVKETAASRIQCAWRKFMTERLEELLARRKEDAARAKADAAANRAAMEAARQERAGGVLSPGGRRVLRPAVCRIHVEEEPLPDRITGNPSAAKAETGALADGTTAVELAPAITVGWRARETLACIPGQQRLHPPKVALVSPAAPSRYFTTRHQGPTRSPSPGKVNGEPGRLSGARRTPSPQRLNVCITSPLAVNYNDEDFNGNISAPWLSPGSTTEDQDESAAFRSLASSDLRQEAAVGVGHSEGPAAVGTSALPAPRAMYRSASFNGFTSPTSPMKGTAPNTNGGSHHGGGGIEDGGARRNGVVLRFEDGFGTQLPGVPQGMLTDKRVSDRMHRDASFAVTSPPSLGSGSNGRAAGRHSGASTKASARVDPHPMDGHRPPSLEPLQHPEQLLGASKITPERPSLPSPSSSSPRLEKLTHHHHLRSRSSSPSVDRAATPTRAAARDVDHFEKSPSRRTTTNSSSSSSSAAATPALIAAAVDALSPRYREEVLSAEVRAFIAPPGEALGAWQADQEQQQAQQEEVVAHNHGRTATPTDHRVGASPPRHRESGAHAGTNTKRNTIPSSHGVVVGGSGAKAGTKMHWPHAAHCPVGGAAVARYPSPDVTRNMLPVRPSSAPSKASRKPPVASPLPGRKLTGTRAPGAAPTAAPAPAGKPPAAKGVASSQYAPPVSPSEVAARAGPEAGWIDGVPPSWGELRKLRETERKAREQHAAMLEVQFASKAALRSGDHDNKSSRRNHTNSSPLLAPLPSPLLAASTSRARPASATRRGPSSSPLFARVPSPGVSHPPQSHQQPQRSRSRSRRSSGLDKDKGSQQHRAPAAHSQPLHHMNPAHNENNGHRQRDPRSSTEASRAPTQPLMSPASPATANAKIPTSSSSSSSSIDRNVYANDPYALELLHAEAMASNRTAVAAEAARLLAELQRAERRAKRRAQIQ